MDAVSNQLTVGYWSIRGLAAPLRMMVMYRNVPLMAQNYDCGVKDGALDVSSWYSVKDQFKAKNALINLPYVVDGDILVTQSNACAQYLGRKLNFMGKSEKDMVDVEQLLCEYMDLRNKVVGFVYRSDTPAVTFLTQLLANNSNLDKLHLWLQRKYEGRTTEGPLFFVGEDVTAADFTIWEMVDQVKNLATFFKLEGGGLANYPLLGLFHEEFRKLPHNQRYFASKLSVLPENNLAAKNYGSTPSGEPYVMGADTPWRDSTVIYVALVFSIERKS